MKNTMKSVAVLSLIAFACAGIVVTGPSAHAREVSGQAGVPAVEIGERNPIQLPPGALVFNWGISNKIIRPKF